MLIEQSPTFLRNRLDLICMTDLFCACPISGAVAWDGRQHGDDRQWQGCVSDPMWSKGSIFLCRATFESNRAQNLGLQATQTLVAIALTDKSQWRATFDYSKRLKKKYDPPVHMPRKRSKGSINGFALLLFCGCQADELSSTTHRISVIRCENHIIVQRQSYMLLVSVTCPRGKRHEFCSIFWSEGNLSAVQLSEAGVKLFCGDFWHLLVDYSTWLKIECKYILWVIRW